MITRDHGPDPSAPETNSRWKASLKRGGKGNPPEDVRASERANAKDMSRSVNNVTPPQQFRNGGKVRRTGLALVHKGEIVIPRNKVRKYRQAMRRSGR